MAIHSTALEKPEWLKVRYQSAASVAAVRGMVSKEGVRTVCDSSQCPNIGECWSKGNATMLILGGICTRHCRFCSVPHGQPDGTLEPGEPERVARAVKALGLRYCRPNVRHPGRPR